MEAVLGSLNRAIENATKQYTSIEELLTAVSRMAEKDASLNTAEETVQQLKNETDPKLQTLTEYKKSLNQEDPVTFVGF